MSEASQTTVNNLKNPPPRELAMPDLKIDMFSLRGFELAQRIAKAFATSDAVPSIFRSHNLKKDKTGETWVENPSAFGNCLVAIETAQAVGMSITAVMQNANVIEGKLSWSGKFIIAAVNASGRFTPLRFAITNKGPIKATYKEKDGWNKEKNKWNMIEHTVELENIECIAWALPHGFILPANVNTLQQARTAGLPIIESAPVSMKMAVEEGWYAKAGSKWQTEMKHLMLQYRAGAYFGNIHAPDVVMGMGQTTEERLDTTIDIVRQPDGSYAANIDELRKSAEDNQPSGGATFSKPADPNVTDVETKPASEAHTVTDASVDVGKPAAIAESTSDEPMTYAQVADKISKAKDVPQLDAAGELIQKVADDDQRNELHDMVRSRRSELKPKAKPSTNMQVD